MDDNAEDTHNLENFTREPCTTKSIGNSRSRQNYASGEPLRRKKKSKLQHSLPCNCQENSKRAPSVETRNAGNVEAVLKKVEHMCNDPFKSSGLKKSQSTPLSPKSAPRCHCKTSGNCHRQQQHEIEKHEKLTAILNDIVENGVANEQIEHCNKFVTPGLKRSSTKESNHWKCNQPLHDTQVYSDVENGYCENRCSENHNLSKRNEALKEMNFVMKFNKKENEWAEEDDEQRFQQEPRGRRIFTSKLPLPRSDSKSPNKLKTSIATSRRNAEGQRNNKNLLRIEASASHHCIDGETDDDFSLDEELRKELENIPYSKPCLKSTTGRNAKLAKSFEIMSHNDKNVNEKREDYAALVKADHPNNDDLDLHASKSHILNLIDKALSKEFGPLDEKKLKLKLPIAKSHTYRNDQMKEDLTRQGPCIEISRVLQGDCCHSWAQTLYHHRGTPDYVRHLKTLRWKYLNHIQDKLKKLYDLEKILDDCSSPRHSLSALQSRTSNIDQLKHCSRAQSSHQQEQKESTS